jgi:hypothetical protein
MKNRVILLFGFFLFNSIYVLSMDERLFNEYMGNNIQVKYHHDIVLSLAEKYSDRLSPFEMIREREFSFEDKNRSDYNKGQYRICKKKKKELAQDIFSDYFSRLNRSYVATNVLRKPLSEQASIDLLQKKIDSLQSDLTFLPLSDQDRQGLIDQKQYFQIALYGGKLLQGDKR